MAINQAIQHVLIQPAPVAHGGNFEKLFGSNGSADFGKVHQDNARLEVVMWIIHAELIFKVGAHG